MTAALLVRALTEPATTTALDAAGWNALVSAARAEQLIGTLAARVDGLAVPPVVADILADAADAAREQRRNALWEAELMRRLMLPLGIPLVLLKGTAYAAAGLAAANGRNIGDLDLLVPRTALGAVERALLRSGWEWAKDNAYDAAYYRRWMHELPPLIHRDRDRIADVHHTILPPTARIAPQPALLFASAVPLGNGLSVLGREDMVIHAALHLFADGDLAGGLRNLWDIDRLLREFADEDRDFWLRLQARAAEHGAMRVVHRAARHANDLYGTPIPESWQVRDSGDPLYRRRFLARDGWGCETRPLTRLAFYVRSHWIRMPPLLLARHLGIKAWTRAFAGRSGSPAAPR